jgi:hypothetical protein
MANATFREKLEKKQKLKVDYDDCKVDYKTVRMWKLQMRTPKLGRKCH